jgi:hypothetical protein
MAQPASTDANGNAPTVGSILDSLGSASSAQPNVGDVFDSVAANEQTPTYSWRSATDNPADAIVRSALQGTAGQVIGGIRGLWDIASGQGVAKASSDIASTQRKFGYAPPPGSTAGRTLDVLASPYDPLNWPAMAGRKLGDVSANLGAPPSVSAALETAGAASPLLLGARSLDFSPYRVGAEEGTASLTATDIANRSLAGQSQSAAAASPSLAAATPGLQKAIVQTAQRTGGAVNPTALTNQLEAEAHDVQLTEGQATRDPALFSNEQNSTDPRMVARLNAQEQQLTDAIDNVRREAAPGTVQNDPIQNGQIAVDALKAYDAPIKADIQAKYKALVDANGGTVPIDTGAFLTNVTQALKKQYLTDSVPPAGAELLRGLKDGEPLDFEGFEAARSRVAEAQRAGGSPAVAAGIIRNQLEQLPLSPAAASLKGLADQARGAARARFQALGVDPAYAAAVDDTTPIGEPSPLADKFLDKFALNAPKANVDLLMQKLGPEGQEAVISHTLNKVRAAAVTPNGKVSANGYNGALQKLGPKLDALVPQPAIRESLDSLGRVITNAKVPPAGNYVNYSKSGVIVNAAKGAAEHTVNAGLVSHGIPIPGGSIARGFMERRAAQKAISRALAPGAGLDYGLVPDRMGNLSDLAK